MFDEAQDDTGGMRPATSYRRVIKEDSGSGVYSDVRGIRALEEKVTPTSRHARICGKELLSPTSLGETNELNARHNSNHQL
jgi:hypothetical protein